ncbi:hypothetical protein ED733_005275 [Metarhizium rileyi]|uniref:CFEM domain-containing protein n=1 Tax=Metarhizium rileyi (strain RCEF 4871) TaxID=1649241 RepID=A0A5C6G8C7_METRR|nr:hypothetical protein ED733_005275 [Metarhizium rileyi]
MKVISVVPVLVSISTLLVQSHFHMAPCARACIKKALPQIGCRGSEEDIAFCLCRPRTKAKLVDPVTQCATESKCSTADLLKAQSIIDWRCRRARPGSFAQASLEESESVDDPKRTTQITGPTRTTQAQTETSTNSISSPPAGTSTDSSTATSKASAGSGLSTGLIVATVTAVAAALGSLAGAFWCYRRRHQPPAASVQARNGVGEEEEEEEKDRIPIAGSRNELSGSSEMVHEMDLYTPQKSLPTELGGKSSEQIYEMDSVPIRKSPEVSASPAPCRTMVNAAPAASFHSPPKAVEVNGRALNKVKVIALVKKQQNTAKLDDLQRRRRPAGERRNLQRAQEAELEEDKRLQKQMHELKEQCPSSPL